MTSNWKRFLRCQAGDMAMEYNVIAAGVAIVALVAVIGATNVLTKVVFKNVEFSFDHGAYGETYDTASASTAMSGDPYVASSTTSSGSSDGSTGSGSGSTTSASSTSGTSDASGTGSTSGTSSTSPTFSWPTR